MPTNQIILFIITFLDLVIELKEKVYTWNSTKEAANKVIKKQLTRRDAVGLLLECQHQLFYSSSIKGKSLDNNEWFYYNR